MPQLLKMNLGNGKVLKEHGLAHIDGNTTSTRSCGRTRRGSTGCLGATGTSSRARTTPPDVM